MFNSELISISKYSVLLALCMFFAVGFHVEDAGASSFVNNYICPPISKVFLRKAMDGIQVNNIRMVCRNSANSGLWFIIVFPFGT